MASFQVRYSDRAEGKLEGLRRADRSVRKRQLHDDARLLLEAELGDDAHLKGWPYSSFRSFRVIDEFPIRFIFWADHPEVWIVDVERAPRKWWRNLDSD